MNKFFYCISDSHRQSLQKKVKEYNKEKTKQTSWFLYDINSWKNPIITNILNHTTINTILATFYNLLRKFSLF